MANRFIYTITSGRSGTMFLSQLLSLNLIDAEVHHERANWLGFGVNSPDASHFTRFNSIGLTPELTEFWQRKLLLDAQSSKKVYAETSHVLFKAGLVEHLHLLPSGSRVDLVVLRRDEIEIAWSHYNRFQFSNTGYTWLWALDPYYPNIIIDSRIYTKFGTMGITLWYVREVFARAEYYNCLVSEISNIAVHDVWLKDISSLEGAANFLRSHWGTEINKARPVVLPLRQNESSFQPFSKEHRLKLIDLAQNIKCSPTEIGREFFASGRRLAAPPVRWRLSQPT